MTMEPNIDTLQELKDFQTYWRTRNLDDPSKLELILEHLVTLTIEQQEEITKLKKYVEKLKQSESDRSANGLDEHY